MEQQTAVELIEAGIKARESHWHNEYQQGYQRALSDIAMYIAEAKAMERKNLKEMYLKGIENYDPTFKRK
jgi:hypothetical protein